jgi:hypothetical protein
MKQLKQLMWNLSAEPVFPLACERSYVEFVFHICKHCWQVKQPMWNLHAIPLCCRQVKLSMEFVCHTCLHCWRVKQPVWYLSSIPVCTVGTWSSLWTMSAIPVCTVVMWSRLWTMSAISLITFGTWSSLWTMSAVPVCTVGTWSSLCGIYMPYLSALLPCEAAFVECKCHTCMHCWHVKQPMRNLSVIHVCIIGTWSSPWEIYLSYLSALSAREAAHEKFICHTCLHYRHMKQPMRNLSVIHVCIIGTWSSLWEIYLSYLSAVAPEQPMWHLSAMHACTVGTWRSLCDICLPYLSAMLAREAANVKFICHACLL